MLCAVYLRGIHVVRGGLEVTPFEVTRYPEHQVNVELLDTTNIEFNWTGPEAVQEESNCTHVFNAPRSYRNRVTWNLHVANGLQRISRLQILSFLHITR